MRGRLLASGLYHFSQPKPINILSPIRALLVDRATRPMMHFSGPLLQSTRNRKFCASSGARRTEIRLQRRNQIRRLVPLRHCGSCGLLIWQPSCKLARMVTKAKRQEA